MNPRFEAIKKIGSRHTSLSNSPFPKVQTEHKSTKASSTHFGARVFNRSVMQRILPKEIYKNILSAMEGREKIKPEYADTIAVAMKEWAISHGATHYCHWFQPLTGFAAEKHDAFIDWTSVDQVIEKFSGKQLIQGEPDASSFPSGGLRSTYEARGYTGWDPTSPVFLWKAGDGITLSIPSVFFSWTGDVLDSKIPLLRSDQKINDAVLRLLKLTGIEAGNVFSTLGCEQEYFVIDRSLRNLRQDLLLLGRTVFGSQPPKGQELHDHYFGVVKDRILSFMKDFEDEALQLGIPVKTRHNEVAPAQHEVAPVFEKASTAVDHNILLMELMRQKAEKHGLACLLHEKPFDGMNGSGKHCNWSLATDTGLNLLDPTDTPENNIHFLILLTAILNSVHKHAALLRASIGSASNDFRLGGNEAPPAIISVYVGEELEHLLDNLEQTGSHKRASTKEQYDLKLIVIPELSKDNTDRNRTSPFAFTGNKFEFRAVGSSANPALPITVLNAIVAESVNIMVDEIEHNLQKQAQGLKNISEAAIPVIRKYLKASKNVRFSGDNYSNEWTIEAKKRRLPNLQKSISAFEALTFDETYQAFEGILTSQELLSRFEIYHEIYSNLKNIEANLMLEIFHTQVLPAAFKQQKDISASLNAYSQASGSEPMDGQAAYLDRLARTIEQALKAASQLADARTAAFSKSGPERSKAFCDTVVPLGDALRRFVDELESLVDDGLWPLPKYRELLFLV